MFTNTRIQYIITPIALLMCLVLLISYLRARWRGNLEAWPLIRFRLGTVFYAVMMFVLMLSLPTIWYAGIATPESLKSPDQAIRFQSMMVADLHRMQEVVNYAFLLSAVWFMGLYQSLREVVPRINKTADQN